MYTKRCLTLLLPALSGLMFTGCQSNSTAYIKNYIDQQNSIYAITGAKAGDRPRFPDSRYDSQTLVWLDILEDYKLGLLNQTLNPSALVVCELPQATKRKLAGVDSLPDEESPEVRGAIDLLEQINTDIEQLKNEVNIEYEFDFYTAQNTCQQLVAGVAVNNAKLFIKAKAIRPVGTGKYLKRIYTIHTLYQGDFDASLQPLPKATMLELTTYQDSWGSVSNFVELSYLVKLAENNHVKFVHKQQIADLILSIFSQSGEAGRVLEQTYYGANPIITTRFKNHKAHGLQEYRWHKREPEFACFEHGNQIIATNDECEKL